MLLQNDVSGVGWVDVSRSGKSRPAPLKLVRNGEKKCNLHYLYKMSDSSEHSESEFYYPDELSDN